MKINEKTGIFAQNLYLKMPKKKLEMTPNPPKKNEKNT
jgi:hypothetical protein